MNDKGPCPTTSPLYCLPIRVHGAFHYGAADAIHPVHGSPFLGGFAPPIFLDAFGDSVDGVHGLRLDEKNQRRRYDEAKDDHKPHAALALRGRSRARIVDAFFRFQGLQQPRYLPQLRHECASSGSAMNLKMGIPGCRHADDCWLRHRFPPAAGQAVPTEQCRSNNRFWHGIAGRRIGRFKWPARRTCAYRGWPCDASLQRAFRQGACR